MKNILIINGHQKYDAAEGKWNQTLMDNMVRLLSKENNIKTTTIQNGYTISEEHEKFLWADVVIYQTPIYWFSVPGLLKTYMDEVYAYGVFFTGAREYGSGGLLTDKNICSQRPGMPRKKPLMIQLAFLMAIAWK